MQTIDRAQIENVIQQLSAIMQGALLMPERRKDDRRINGKTQGNAPDLAHQVREPAHQVATQERAQVAPAQAPAPAPAKPPRKPAQDARPVAAEWPFQTYAAPKRPFPGYLWPYELKKMSKARRDEYFRKLNTGEIGPDQGDDQESNQADQDRRGAGAPGKRSKVTAPGKTQAERERAETLAKFAELDRLLAQGGGDFKIDFGTHSATYQAIMVNCLNKGMPTRAAHNFAAKKAYGEKAILY